MILWPRRWWCNVAPEMAESERGGGVRLYTHAACSGHDPGLGHRERPERLTAISAAVDAAGLAARLQVCEPRPAPARGPGTSARGLLRGDDPGPARGAAGGWTPIRWSAPAAWRRHCTPPARRWTPAPRCWPEPPARRCARCVRRGTTRSATTRWGFCLFNNVAVAAAAALAGPLQRVLVLDPDVHHGNGTQHLFYRSAAVYYVSIHQYPFYPGTGAAGERGSGPGAGYTLNLPLPGRVGR